MGQSPCQLIPLPKVKSVVPMAPGDHLNTDNNDPIFTQTWLLQGAGMLVAGWWGLKLCSLGFALEGCFSALKCYEVSVVGGCEVDRNC